MIMAETIRVGRRISSAGASEERSTPVVSALRVSGPRAREVWASRDPVPWQGRTSLGGRGLRRGRAWHPALLAAARPSAGPERRHAARGWASRPARAPSLPVAPRAPRAVHPRGHERPGRAELLGLGVAVHPGARVRTATAAGRHGPGAAARPGARVRTGRAAGRHRLVVGRAREPSGPGTAAGGWARPVEPPAAGARRRPGGGLRPAAAPTGCWRSPAARRGSLQEEPPPRPSQRETPRDE